MYLEVLIYCTVRRTGKKYFLPVQLTTSRIGNLTRLIHTLALCGTIHTYCKAQVVSSYSRNVGVVRRLPFLSFPFLYRRHTNGSRARFILEPNKYISCKVPVDPTWYVRVQAPGEVARFKEKSVDLLGIPQSGGGGEMSRRLGGIKGCKYKTSSWHINGFPAGNNIGQQYNLGEKPTVILYTYINRHPGTPEKTVKTRQRQRSTLM